jgi:hypothetical protein
MQGCALKAELELTRENAELNGKRAAELHEKCILLQNDIKQLKEELSNIKRTHSECYKMGVQSDTSKAKIL